ncbi:hypothetical protein A3F03_01160 [Candidatus Roizmanbacteria bacterium RIFCSPHIGHO2_12_FULL_41_11]|uniref:Phage holin family protein n=3 Tax=Candidatus Roizmaniibacteriota TaxID=1752723 RepID=A0A1F7JR24_9BACT|nr:MAG: hypothetical protein A3F03_01160 [Candidatus Roizmanbacteria bacterium RIFCSPHIGHO2_12_FULL_41_11]OGK51796.1 MAG: hypothetical protein A2966_04100 [Candidatus Roizmanbacteria bacterium RIFCSPLOWO2_01_FULL_41_22]OGK58077.1 MAG: hypothetical protein A3H86_02660 [Candidatus Roizmanbacteria bacterium RIFCSPLOWO2_02_FULL_41_9]
MGILIKLIVNTLAVVITAYLLNNSVRINNFTTAAVVAVMLSFINTFIKPILNLLALPFNIITLGLFSLVVNGFLILLISRFVPGFKVDGLLWAIIFGLVLSLVNAILQKLT